MNRIVIFLLSSFFSAPIWAQVDEIKLEKAIEMALENNLQIRLARIDAEVAQVGNNLGEAGFLPEFNLNLQGDQSIQDINLVFFSGEQISQDGAGSRALLGTARVDWTIFDGLRMFATKDRLQSLQRIGEVEVRRQVEQTIADVLIAYADLLVQKAMLDFNKENVQFSRERLAIAEGRALSGTGTHIDFLRAKNELNADSSAYLRQIYVLEAQKARFCQLIGIDPQTDYGIVPIDIEFIDFTLQDFMDKVEQDNYEQQRARLEMLVAEHEIKENQSAFLPQVGLFGEYINVRQINDVGILQRNRALGYNYGFTARWNLFDGWRDRRRTQQLRLMQQGSAFAVEDTERKIKAEAMALWGEHFGAQKVYKLENETLEMAEENLKLAISRFEEGLIDDLEVQDAKQTLNQAQLRYLQSELDIYRSGIRMLELSGMAFGFFGGE